MGRWLSAELKLPANEVSERVGNWFEVYYVLEHGYGWISPMRDGLKVELARRCSSDCSLIVTDVAYL